ncbi:hypothetical protein NP493_1427g01025 [Ridgeia piscesae]|uniref:Uncharacterized protein n=1 Tax=Ridgeia piscesae TaxID=27915 RepID=A0AAD9K440_RIDPI|nr:hypothetical protein NP493_1427g01025 [Ridgeia piscesae]
MTSRNQGDAVTFRYQGYLVTSRNQGDIVTQRNQGDTAIDWRRLFSLIFDEVNITINGSLPVAVIGSAFFKDLAQLLKITPKR